MMNHVKMVLVSTAFGAYVTSVTIWITDRLNPPTVFLAVKSGTAKA
jgi:hypothetical protein